MKKEMLQSKKQQIILYKNELNRLEEEKKQIVSMNEKLDIKNNELKNSIQNLNSEILEYNRIKESNKFHKKLMLIIFILIVVISIFSTNIVSILLTAIIGGGVFSIPYFITKNYLKNINFKDLIEQLNNSFEEQKENRNIYENNKVQLKELERSTTDILNNLDVITLNLLKDKESRDEIMEYIINNAITTELLDCISDSVVEEAKVKLIKK